MRVFQISCANFALPTDCGEVDLSKATGYWHLQKIEEGANYNIIFPDAKDPLEV